VHGALALEGGARPADDLAMLRRTTIALGLLVLSVLGLALGGCSAETAPSGPRAGWFQGGFEEALAQSRATQKLVLVDLWTEW
jgi:hypothetical protein